MTSPVENSRRATLRAAIGDLGEWVAGLTIEAVDETVRSMTDLVVFDTVGVTLAGARTPEMAAMLRQLRPADGPARLLGTGRQTTMETATLWGGTAACVLELDEGNKHVRGHPAGHVLPVTLAMGAATEARGAEVLSAFLAGHEVASRFGRATTIAGDVHPHGHWGITGAAAACAKLLGLDAAGVAAAIDAAAGLALAPPFQSSLTGSFVRNTWLGVAGVHGLLAAQLAAAGLADLDGTAAYSLGGLLGDLNPKPLTESLGERFDITLGYLKRHAACSFTHPAIDAVLDIRAREPSLDHQQVKALSVETHSAAARLREPAPRTRLAAMFSIPHTVAAALVRGRVDPPASDSAARDNPDIRRLAAATSVTHHPTFDTRAPAERPARVTLTLADGSTLSQDVPNPVGDADHMPLSRADVRSKLQALIGPVATETVERQLAGLADAPVASHVVAGLP